MVLIEQDLPVYDIEGVAGTEYRRVFEWQNEDGTPVEDWTGWAVRGQVREDAESEEVLLDLDFALAPTELTLIAFTSTPMRGWYDVELVPVVGNPVYFIGGKFRMKQGVTEP